jgi:hypothetical protein
MGSAPRASWWRSGSINRSSEVTLPATIDALAARLVPRLAEAARTWLAAARAETARDESALGRHFPAAARKVGHSMLLASPAPEGVRLFSGGPVLDPWRVDEAARVLLLLEDAGREPAGALARANTRYFVSDGGERIALLRSLALLPEGEAALPAVRDALRANAADLFAAAICENGYASRHLPDDLFNQAVLKCAFVGLRLGRIERVEERATPELARMLFAYVTEREHAGRSVGADLWPLIALHPPAGTAERIRSRQAAGPDPEARRLLEVALARAER